MTMKLSTIALATLPVLAACSVVPPAEPVPAPPTDGQTYVARGNEPGWILKMDGKTIDYQGDYGETRIAVPQITGVPSFNGMRYVTPRLTVDVTYASCADDMSGQRYADTVTVVADGKQVKGCGGRALPPESLDDTSWKILSIDDIPVSQSGKAAELRFADGKVSGSAGCNGLSGSYVADAANLTFGAIAATRMMCPEPQMGQETKLLAIMKGKASTRYTVDGNLIITGENGSRVTLQQIF